MQYSGSSCFLIGVGRDFANDTVTLVYLLLYKQLKSLSATGKLLQSPKDALAVWSVELSCATLLRAHFSLCVDEVVFYISHSQ